MSIGLWAAFLGAFLLAGACTEEDRALTIPAQKPDVGAVGQAKSKAAELRETYLAQKKAMPGIPETFDDECCDEVGMVDDCWLSDAADDGVICPSWTGKPAGYDTTCASGLGCGTGAVGALLCQCDDDADCQTDDSSGSRDGVCLKQYPTDTTGLCVPSWCNGYKVCSCWGGCIEGSAAPPENTCTTSTSAPYCCDGLYYPENIFDGSTDDSIGSGYCSDTACGVECAINADCSDGNACTVDLCLSGGVCDYSTLVTCPSDGNPCTDEICVPTDTDGDPCQIQNDDTNTCTDSNACTTGDQCVSGTCTTTGTLTCAADGNPCTDDHCNPVAHGAEPEGCAYPVNTANPCTDGNPCTLIDVCNASGACTGSGAPDCSDTNSCTDDHCNPIAHDGEAAGCVNVAMTGTGCDDGDACTTGDQCTSLATCEETGNLNCTDTNPCTDDHCNSAAHGTEPAGCVALPLTGTACTDNNVCTTGDICQAGACVTTGTLPCTTTDQCRDTDCNPVSGCGTHIDPSNPCTDSNACTTGDNCNASGSCVSTGTNTCNDANPCTDDICTSTDSDGNPCTNPPDTGHSCSDSNYCNNEACNSSGQCVQTAVVCDDSNPCTLNNCNSSDSDGNPCNFPPGAGTCTDSNACTTDVCSAGACVSTAITCTDSNQCTNDHCNPVAHGSEAAGCVTPALTGSPCNDGSYCTTGDTCSSSAVCVSGTTNTCNDSNPCTNDLCTSTDSDGDPCTHTVNTSCCSSDSQCNSTNGGCNTSIIPTASGGCGDSKCVSSVCQCQMRAVGTACTAYDLGDYPSNCYSGACGLSGGSPNGLCTGYYNGVAPTNNLCSDLWSDNTTINTTNVGYLGQFANSAPSGTLVATGSTRCGYNNYSATGSSCKDKPQTTDLGTYGKDVVYAFKYQTNSATDFNLYSFVVKVQADYDVAVYITDNISTAAGCPEGFNPSYDDSAVYPAKTVSSARCIYPYNDGDNAVPPYVVEDECNASGNTQYDQECCDGCADYYCGYKWCTRGYDNDGSSCDQCGGSSDLCDGFWQYPQDPVECSNTTPTPPGYDDYIQSASAVIFPDGDTNGSWRTVFIFVDGEGTAAAIQSGNFYLSVEKRVWYSSPCDRRNDDLRVYDITNVGASGQVFLGTLAGAVNSGHSGGGGSCGGYSCDNSDWTGGLSCHSSSAGNMFWPAEVQFKVEPRASDSTYCLMTDEAITDPADTVISYSYRADSSAMSICDEDYWYDAAWCKWNNFGANARIELNIPASRFYLFGLSEHNFRNRPCLPSQGDDCNFKLNVYQGACPSVCLSPAGGAAGTFHMNTSYYDAQFGSGTVDNSDGDEYNPGNDGYDEVWAVYNDLGANTSVTFTLQGTGDAYVAVYDCYMTLLGEKDYNGAGAADSVTVTVPSGANAVHVVADTFPEGSALGAYTLRAKWGTPPAACVPYTNWYTDTKMGDRTVSGATGSVTMSGTTSGTSYCSYGSGPDDIWQINVTGDHSATFGLCTGTAFDTRLALYDCLGTRVAYNDDSCGLQSRFSWTLDDFYTPYYLVVDGYGGASGAYTATVTW